MKLFVFSYVQAQCVKLFLFSYFQATITTQCMKLFVFSYFKPLEPSPQLHNAPTVPELSKDLSWAGSANPKLCMAHLHKLNLSSA